MLSSANLAGEKLKYKVLVVHNAYQQRGGEDSVVDSEVELLEGFGHHVSLYSRSNDEIQGYSKLQLGLQTLWSQRSYRRLVDLISDFRPDVVHVHNTFPLISPSAYWAAASVGVPVVQTLHNFRLICPQAMFLRGGKVCEDCSGNVPWRAVVRRCYRGSFAQSSVLAGMVTLHRASRTWNSKISRYIALNDFCRQKFIEGGLPADRIVVKPNFVSDSGYVDKPRSGILYVGRISVEKGIETLAKAVRADHSIEMVVAGAGELDHLLSSTRNIEQIGSVDQAEIRSRMRAALALVVPSIWYENFPRTIVEAFSTGLPVIASRIGALAEIVEDGETGLLFEPGSEADLLDKLRWAIGHPSEMARMGRNARAIYESLYSPETNYRRLIQIYDEAIQSRHS